MELQKRKQNKYKQLMRQVIQLSESEDRIVQEMQKFEYYKMDEGGI